MNGDSYEMNIPKLVKALRANLVLNLRLLKFSPNGGRKTTTELQWIRDQVGCKQTVWHEECAMHDVV